MISGDAPKASTAIKLIKKIFVRTLSVEALFLDSSQRELMISTWTKAVLKGTILDSRRNQSDVTQEAHQSVYDGQKTTQEGDAVL